MNSSAALIGCGAKERKSHGWTDLWRRSILVKAGVFFTKVKKPERRGDVDSPVGMQSFRHFEDLAVNRMVEFGIGRIDRKAYYSDDLFERGHSNPQMPRQLRLT